MSDLTERLRIWPAGYGDDTMSSTVVGKLMREGADEIVSLGIQLARARSALKELHAQVLGECPSLLNEDSGGDSMLDLEIRAILSLTS
jgi:hypothetical protein